MPLPKEKIVESVGPDGIFYKNPTHIEEGEIAKDQNSIVKTINRDKRVTGETILRYKEENKPWVLPGFAKMRELNEKQIVGLCDSLMRFRPNIFGVHIRLGTYANKKEFTSMKVRLLSSDESRFSTEVATKLSDVLSDRSVHIVEVLYKVNSANTGNFRSTATVYYVEEEDYNNDDLFNPEVMIEFVTNI